MARGFAKQVNAMGTYNETYEIEQAIKDNLQGIMENAIRIEASAAIREAAMERVYSYSPEFNHRRYAIDGIADTHTYVANYHPEDQEIIIEIKTPWQNIGFRRTTGMGNELADVIESSKMYHAPARPFTKRAEQIISSNRNRLAEIIAQYLNRTV